MNLRQIIKIYASCSEYLKKTLSGYFHKQMCSVSYETIIIVSSHIRREFS